ncbi:MAG: choice-of-anchor J domain-containing protein [Armatimonadetes bacterium]|nr:choice-of-anchor J domain-containing protein [Armatimonadota bacterium]
MIRFLIPLLCAALLAPPSPVAAQTVLLSEDFDAVNTLTGQGWAFRNTSTEPGEFWGGGDEFIFPAQSGLPDSYAASGFDATAGNVPDEIISNWLLTPVLSFTNNVSVSFWTRTISPVFAPDRFELRLSTSGESTNVGDSPASTGDFGTLLLEVNAVRCRLPRRSDALRDSAGGGARDSDRAHWASPLRRERRVFRRERRFYRRGHSARTDPAPGHGPRSG